MSGSGYYRFPTLHGNTIVFTSEDDLWAVSTEGGIARRLTANLGTISHPFFSPDGSLLAFTSREEGHNEVYVMEAEGGAARRVTYLGVTSMVIGWTPDGKILFASDHTQPFDRITWVYSVSPEGGKPELYPVGPAVSISVAADGRCVIGRNNNDPARWKRYRGGTAGDLWVDATGSGEFRRLLKVSGNPARPMWIGDRVFFLSDHEGIANIYSCTPTGEDITRHTERRDYFARFPSTDGSRIVYHAGADLWLYDPRTGTDTRVDIRYHSPRVQAQRKFVDAADYLESYELHPKGHSLAITARGRSATFGNFEGPVAEQAAPKAPARTRLTNWLNDGKRVVSVVDLDGVDALEIHSAGGSEPSVRLTGLDIGRPLMLSVSPTADQVVLSNHRNELIFVDLTDSSLKRCDRSDFGTINSPNWSPDGRWVAYSFHITQYQTALKLWDRTGDTTHVITKPVLHDMQPSFDPEGKYLYFIGARELNPVYDNLQFELSFPKGTRPYLLTLRADLPSPFVPVPGQLEQHEAAEMRKMLSEVEHSAEEAGEGGEKPTSVKPVQIDLEGIEARVVAFPVPEGLYGQIGGVEDRVFFTSFPVEGAIRRNPIDPDSAARGTLEAYDFKALKQETLISGMNEFTLSRDGKTLAYRAGNRLRVVKTREKPDAKAGREPGRKSGYVDLGRVKLMVEPRMEWRQMAREAWLLQREFFWTEDMSKIDWTRVWERYEPLIDRLGTRGEFSDLMWEMQGELGTSHAYEAGGDYRKEPAYPQGFLGADYRFDAEAGGYRVARIVQGAAGEENADSPLRGPGINVREGDLIRAINGRKPDASTSPQELLIHQADTEVALTVENKQGAVRVVTVRTLRSEFPARYREWVETNRERVHQATGGRVGYIHIPDMMGRGFAEFHRLYLAEVAYDGLIVDVRYNRGGHVSQLLIEKLARKRLGYDISRWGKPDPYPSYSVAGPMVALTNQWAGSDGDIFSHVFKLKKLGTLIGKRTWGGVIGISPRNPLVDGAITTQPEYSFWFEDVGWGVENYGTDPDVDIDISPQDYVHNIDPQMEAGLRIILEQLEANPPVKPSFADRPNLSLP